LKPEQLPADSAPAPSFWPWVDRDGEDLFTPHQQHTSTPSNPEHGTAPSTAREALRALPAQSPADQPAPQSPRRFRFPVLPPSLVTAGCVALAVVGGLVAALMVVFHTRSTPMPSFPAAPPQLPAPTSPAVLTGAAITPHSVTLPTPAPTPPPPAAPAPNPPTDHTTPVPGAVPAPARPHPAQTSRHSPSPDPAPAPPPQTPAPQLDRPQWAGGDAPPAPDTPACTTDCAQPTPNRTPTHWSPDSP